MTYRMAEIFLPYHTFSIHITPVILRYVDKRRTLHDAAFVPREVLFIQK